MSDIKYLLSILNKHKSKQVLGFILTIIYSILVFLGPIVSQNLIDYIIPSKSAEKVTKGLLIFSLIFIFQPIIMYFQNRIFTKISEDITSELRLNMYESVIEKELNFFHIYSRGEIISRIINDSRIIGDFISDFFIVLIKNILMIIMVIIGMIYLSPHISIIIFLIIFTSLFIIICISRKLQKYSKLAQESYDFLTENASDSINNIIPIKIYNLKEFLKTIYEGNLEKSKNYNLNMRNLSSFLNMFLETVTIACIIIIYSIGFNNVIRDKITLGTVIALVLYFQMLTSPLISLLNSNIGFQKILPILSRVKEYNTKGFEYNFEKEDINLKGDIHIKNLYFQYAANKYVLENVNLFIKENTFTSIIGESGCGKTTLINLILGLLKPNKGEILIDGINIERLSNKCNILLVPQSSKLLHMSIKENIRCGNTAILDEYIFEVCKEINIYEDILNFPNGFDTVISDELNISGGQAQRILIARALVRKPSIIILDEPTSALDEENKASILKLLIKLKKLSTVIVITHDRLLINESDMIVRINNKSTEIISSKEEKVYELYN